MDNLFDLPPLPEPEDGPMMNRHPYFTADQMRAYARAAVEAEREACAKLCVDLEEGRERGWDPSPYGCASAIRARKEHS